MAVTPQQRAIRYDARALSSTPEYGQGLGVASFTMSDIRRIMGMLSDPNTSETDRLNAISVLNAVQDAGVDLSTLGASTSRAPEQGYAGQRITASGARSVMAPPSPAPTEFAPMEAGRPQARPSDLGATAYAPQEAQRPQARPVGLAASEFAPATSLRPESRDNHPSAYGLRPSDPPLVPRSPTQTYGPTTSLRPQARPGSPTAPLSAQRPATPEQVRANMDAWSRMVLSDQNASWEDRQRAQQMRRQLNPRRQPTSRAPTSVPRPQGRP